MRGDRNHGQARCAIVAVLGVEGDEAVRRARLNFARRGEPRTAEGCCLGLVLPYRCARAWGSKMQIDRANTEKFLAMLGFTLSFLLLLAVIALAFT
jgi:hypothetical protein